MSPGSSGATVNSATSLCAVKVFWKNDSPPSSDLLSDFSRPPVAPVSTSTPAMLTIAPLSARTFSPCRSVIRQSAYKVDKESRSASVSHPSSVAEPGRVSRPGSMLLLMLLRETTTSLQEIRRVDRRAILLDHEVNVGSGRGSGAADRADHVALVHLLPHENVRLLRHVAVDGRKPVAVVDLDVVTESAVAPPGRDDRAAVRRHDRRVHRRRQVNPVVEVAAEIRVVRLDREPGAPVRLGENV